MGQRVRFVVSGQRAMCTCIMGSELRDVLSIDDGQMRRRYTEEDNKDVEEC